MGRIVVTEFVSMDGVMEDPGGSESFRHGGWSFEVSRGDEGDKFKLDETMASDALLLGRATYEGFAEAWPTRDGEFADRFNSMPKYVVSSTLENPEWTNSTVLEGDLGEAVAKLKEEHEGDIVVHGSATLVQALVESGSSARRATRGASSSSTRKSSATAWSSSCTRPRRTAGRREPGGGRRAHWRRFLRRAGCGARTGGGS
jgi:dihydrofolate reductase